MYYLIVYGPTVALDRRGAKFNFNRCHSLKVFFPKLRQNSLIKKPHRMFHCDTAIFNVLRALAHGVGIELADFVGNAESGYCCSGLQDNFGYFQDSVHPVGAMACFFHSFYFFEVMNFGDISCRHIQNARNRPIVPAPAGRQDLLTDRKIRRERRGRTLRRSLEQYLCNRIIQLRELRVRSRPLRRERRREQLRLRGLRSCGASDGCGSSCRPTSWPRGVPRYSQRVR